MHEAQRGRVDAIAQSALVARAILEDMVADVTRSTAFYRDVLGAEVLRVGEPTFLRLGNLWLTINIGGGPTDDKPDVIATPPKELSDLSFFLNLRVTDIKRFWIQRTFRFR